MAAPAVADNVAAGESQPVLPFAGEERERAILSLGNQVRLVVNNYRFLRAAELDDIHSVAWLGAIEAVDRFDPKRGCKLKTYADRVIRGRILDALRTMDHLPRSERQRVKAGEMEEPGVLSFAEPGYRTDATLTGLIVAQLLSLAALTGRQFEVIRLHYFEGLGLSEIAKRLGTSGESIWITRRRALQKLRAAAGT